ncbi:hypothetical protein D3C72_1792020 [compost metagenome]
MDIADLHDREAVQVLRQAGNRHVHIDDARSASRVVEPDQRAGRRQPRHGPRADAAQPNPRQIGARSQVDEPGQQQDDIADRRQHEQR